MPTEFLGFEKRLQQSVLLGYYPFSTKKRDKC